MQSITEYFMLHEFIKSKEWECIVYAWLDITTCLFVIKNLIDLKQEITFTLAQTMIPFEFDRRRKSIKYPSHLLQWQRDMPLHHINRWNGVRCNNRHGMDVMLPQRYSNRTISSEVSWFEHFIAVDCCNELLVILNFHHKSSLMSEINTETQKPKNNTFQPRDDIWLDWICVLSFGSMFTLNIPESTFNLMHTMSILCQQYEYKSWFNNVCYVWVCSANTVQSLTNKQKKPWQFSDG